MESRVFPATLEVSHPDAALRGGAALDDGWIRSERTCDSGQPDIEIPRLVRFVGKDLRLLAENPKSMNGLPDFHESE